jgi:hypothetical protein
MRILMMFTFEVQFDYIHQLHSKRVYIAKRIKMVLLLVVLLYSTKLVVRSGTILDVVGADAPQNHPAFRKPHFKSYVDIHFTLDQRQVLPSQCPRW